jgi:hypothetical protein
LNISRKAFWLLPSFICCISNPLCSYPLGTDCSPWCRFMSKLTLPYGIINSKRICLIGKKYGEISNT